MEKMNMRKNLIESAIRVVSKYGLDKATTNKIAKDVQVNEAYIYRLFSDKDDLLKNTFVLLDGEFADCLIQNLPVMEDTKLSLKERCRQLFFRTWKFILRDRERCMFYIRFYYSRHFDGVDENERNKRYQKVVEVMKPAFLEGTDVWKTLFHLCDMMFTSAIRIIRYNLQESDEIAEEVFHRMYKSVEDLLAWEQPACAIKIAEKTA